MDLGFECRGLGKLGVQFGDEARHFFLKGVAVIFDFLGADVAARGEDVAVRGGFAIGLPLGKWGRFSASGGILPHRHTTAKQIPVPIHVVDATDRRPVLDLFQRRQREHSGLA